MPRSLSRADWAAALAAFDLLHGGRVQLGRRRLTFQSFYMQHIDAVHSQAFIDGLLAADDTETSGARLQVERWRQIVSSLAAVGVTEASLEARALITYCLYWWRSFSVGYVREVAVFRDLERSGVAFEAHDLRDPAQRRSAHDLRVLEMRGDVKSSTSFIHTARAFPLRCDFYIVRLWDDTLGQWHHLVLLKPAAWRTLNGEPTPCTWETIVRVLPDAAQLDVRGEALVVIPYEEWKSRILRKQSEGRLEGP
jgi:hypothetical protein